MENSLRKSRLDIDTLNSMLRQKEVFSMKDVKYAIFETSGQLSVMKYENKQSVSKGDLQIPNKTSIFPTSTQVISDGKIITNNLSRLNLDNNWLNQQLQNAGITNLSQVFYAEIQQDGSLYIDKKDDNMLH